MPKRKKHTNKSEQEKKPLLDDRSYSNGSNGYGSGSDNSYDNSDDARRRQEEEAQKEEEKKKKRSKKRKGDKDEIDNARAKKKQKSRTKEGEYISEEVKDKLVQRLARGNKKIVDDKFNSLGLKGFGDSDIEKAIEIIDSISRGDKSHPAGTPEILTAAFKKSNFDVTTVNRWRVGAKTDGRKKQIAEAVKDKLKDNNSTNKSSDDKKVTALEKALVFVGAVYMDANPHVNRSRKEKRMCRGLAKLAYKLHNEENIEKTVDQIVNGKDGESEADKVNRERRNNSIKYYLHGEAKCAADEVDKSTGKYRLDVVIETVDQQLKNENSSSLLKLGDDFINRAEKAKPWADKFKNGATTLLTGTMAQKSGTARVKQQQKGDLWKERTYTAANCDVKSGMGK